MDGSTPPPAARLGLAWTAVVAAVGTAATALLSRGGHSVTFDTFRDLAWVHAILQGRVWADPVLLGEPVWYPPGNPLLMAAVAALGGLDPVALTASSAVWWNGLIPLLLVVAVATAVDRPTALVALPMVVLGSLWWLTHLAAPMPSVQGVVFTLVGLTLWTGVVEAEAGGGRWRLRAGLVGAVMAAAAWFHPLCAIVLAATVAVHGVSLAWRRRRARSLGAVAVVAAVAAVLAAPITLHLGRLPANNPVPLRYLARELFNPDFALHLHAPLVLPLAVMGAILVARGRDRSGWLVAWLAVAVLGQGLGYLHRLSAGLVPCVLPHEFQWHGQIAVGTLAAVGLVGLSRQAVARWTWPTDLWLRWLLWLGGGLVATLGPALAYLPVADAYLLDLRPLEETRGEAVAWIRDHVAEDEVVAAGRLHSHLVVAGLAGRGAVAVPVGFMNTALDPGDRFRDLEVLLTTEDEAEFLAVARRRRVRWLLVVIDSPEAEALAHRAATWASLELAHRSQRSPTVVFAVR